MKSNKITHNKLGYLGEMYVLYKLAKFGISATSLPNHHDYDIITEHNLRIEVKTATIQTAIRRKKTKKGYTDTPRNLWQFHNGKRSINCIGNKSISYEYSKRDRDCDFFVLVCMDKEMNIVRTYVVPKEIIGNKINMVAGEKDLGYLSPYKNRWDELKLA